MTQPTSYDRLRAARVVRPLCWDQKKPHLFKHEGIWRVSLFPPPPIRRLDTRTPEERTAVLLRWNRAYSWLSQQQRLERLP